VSQRNSAHKLRILFAMDEIMMRSAPPIPADYTTMPVRKFPVSGL
jgi:hypothetical protein